MRTDEPAIAVEVFPPMPLREASSPWYHRLRLAAFIVTLLTLGTGAIILETYGNLLAAGAALAAAAVFILSWYRVEWGFYWLIAMVLLFDQFDVPGFDSLTYGVAYFRNLKEIPYLPAAFDFAMNPLELQLALLLAVWFVVIATRRDVPFVPIPAWGAFVLFFFALAAAFVYGLRQGGDLLPALWEVRALVYLGLLYVFVPQVIRTREQLSALCWICIAAISFKAFQGIWRFARLGFSFQGYPTLTNHEDPVFILDLIILLFGFVIYNVRSLQKPALALLLFPLVAGFLTGQRRAAYAAILPTCAAFVAAVPKKVQRTLLKTVIPVAVLVGLYCAVFWNSESRLASPVRLVKTGLSSDPKTAGERYYSNLYREIEKADLAQTVRHAPAFGIGFGNKYEMPLPLVKIDFPLRDYIPHDQILWLLVKMGAAGFCLFWFFIDTFACGSAMILRTVRDPYLRAVGTVSIAAVVNQLVVSNYDLQLTYYRNMVLLGTLMGFIPAIASIDRRERNAR